MFERAQGGTLLLDDVGELPMAVQARLLRVLETGTWRASGRTNRSRWTSASLRPRIARSNATSPTGRFRADLYYRLNVFQVRVPPLRDRRGDIPLLIDHLLERISRAQDRPLLA